MHGCYADDVHAICIHHQGQFITARPQVGWTSSIEECACFLSEKNALLALEELRTVRSLSTDEAALIWTDTRKSIYADLEELRRFEQKQIAKDSMPGLY